MMKLTLIGLLALAFGATFANAEQVRIPLGDASDQILEKPHRGLTSRAVERDFGPPQSKHGPIGDPAIYFWEYEQFTVYFENDYVLHSVSKVKSKTPIKTSRY